jgi:hypothetical protein
MNLESVALLWLNNNNITPTNERVRSLISLLAKVENIVNKEIK